MKRKINAQYILLTICAILLTLSATTFVYYRAVRAEVMDSLKSYAHVLQEASSRKCMARKRQKMPGKMKSGLP